MTIDEILLGNEGAKEQLIKLLCDEETLFWNIDKIITECPEEKRIDCAGMIAKAICDWQKELIKGV